jgi:hypothetical protein
MIQSLRKLQNGYSPSNADVVWIAGVGWVTGNAYRSGKYSKKGK